MRWLWNNNVAVIQFGAVLVCVGFVCALLAFIGLGLFFHVAYLGSVTIGTISILCGLIIFCLQFGVKSDPKKVISLSLTVQGLMAISFFGLHDLVNFYARLYSPLIALSIDGLWFVSIEMAALLLLIGLIRLLFYNRRQS
jgi:hypothetical protein